jgi:drug/metabolite transporter (DMT)-like permease
MTPDFQIVVIGLILFVALGSATWNALVKINAEPLVLVTLMVLPQIMIALPFALTHIPENIHTLEIIGLSSCVQTAYIIFLVKAYADADLSVVYPISIGLAPLFSFGFSHWIDAERLYWIELFGVMLISFGAIGFSLFNQQFWQDTSSKTKSYTLIVALLISTYGLLDSYGVKYENNSTAYISWLFLIKGLILLIPMILFKKIKLLHVKTGWRNYMVAGLLAGIGYATAVWSFYYVVTPLVLALRASSIVFTVILAKLILKEQVSFYKIVLSAIIVSGIALIVVY